MVFVSSKHNKQKVRGVTIKVYTQGLKGSKTITLQDTSIKKVYDYLIKKFKEESNK